MCNVLNLLLTWTGHLEGLLYSYMLVQATCYWHGPVFCTVYKIFNDFMSIQKFGPHDRYSQKCHNITSDFQRYAKPGYFEVKEWREGKPDVTVPWTRKASHKDSKDVTVPWTRKASHKDSKYMFLISIIRPSTNQIFMHSIAANKYCMKEYPEELHCFDKVIITRLIGNESE